jgi:UDP-N-acetylmuramate--alanine ligase
MIKLENIKKVFFLGIGGIGMSAIARYFLMQKCEVFGYDKTSTVLTDELVEEGMKIHFDDNINNIPENIDLVIYTPAIPKNNKEYNFILNQKMPMFKRSQVLGLLSKSLKTIAIAGTHGKTTTSTITAHLLREGGIDCTAFLGGISKNFDSNFVYGTSEYVVVEADEYDRSFLQLYPTYAGILSMDADHLDIYGSHENMIESGFKKFASQTQKGGIVLVRKNLDLGRIVNEFGDVNIQKFGLEKTDYYSDNIRVEDNLFTFDYYFNDHKIEKLQFTLPGLHNVENATLAITIAKKVGVTDSDIRKALLSFQGIRRRFDFVIRNEKVVYIDDYAHHPTELSSAIQAAKMLYPTKKITGIFQPHLFSRTNDFAEGFAQSLDMLDEIILMDIYPARELPMPGVTSSIIFDKMKNKNKILTTKAGLMGQLKNLNIEVLITLGAGDIDTFIEPIKNYLI